MIAKWETVLSFSPQYNKMKSLLDFKTFTAYSKSDSVQDVETAPKKLYEKIFQALPRVNVAKKDTLAMIFSRVLASAYVC